MPTLHIQTNVPADRLKLSEALKALSKATSSSVGKPEQWIMCSITPDAAMIFGGTEEPAAWGTLGSIGSVGGDKNKAITKAIADVLQSKLGIPAARFYLKIDDVNASNQGWNGSTFA